MTDQDKLFKLLDPTRIGCVLTENWQIFVVLGAARTVAADMRRVAE